MTPDRLDEYLEINGETVQGLPRKTQGYRQVHVDIYVSTRVNMLVGVSNFSVEFLERLLANSEVMPAVNQVELHPYVLFDMLLALFSSEIFRSCPQQDIVDFCNNKGIAITAYSPLGSINSPLPTNAIVKKIADKYKVQPANILISLQANRPGVNGTRPLTPLHLVTV